MTTQPKTVAELRASVHTLVDRCVPMEAGLASLDDLCRRAEANERLRTAAHAHWLAAERGILSYAESKALRESLAAAPSQNRYSDDRMSLAQEIAETLSTRGHWVPKDFAGPDLITAVGKALESTKDGRDDTLADIRAQLGLAAGCEMVEITEAVSRLLARVTTVERSSREDIKHHEDRCYKAEAEASQLRRKLAASEADAKRVAAEPAPDETRILGMDCAMRMDARSQKDAVMDALDAAEPVPDTARAEGDKVLRDAMAKVVNANAQVDEGPALLAKHPEKP